SLSVDIEYVAVASPGAYVTGVFFTHNDGRIQYIYVHGGEPMFASDGMPIRNVLGYARIPLFGGENRRTFTVRDSAGLEASYVVDGVPVLADWDEMNVEGPPFSPEDREYISEDSWIITTRLMLLLERGLDTAASFPLVEEIIAPLGGTIVGYALMFGRIEIMIPPHTHEELIALGDMLVSEHPELFRGYDTFFGTYRSQADGVEFYAHAVPRTTTTEPEEVDTHPLNDNEVNERIDMPSFQNSTGNIRSNNFNNDWGIHSNVEWNLVHTGFTQAWEDFGGQERHGTRIGVLDEGFLPVHESLQIPASNIRRAGGRSRPGNLPPFPNHGTMVMGVIASTQDNTHGMSGAINIEREQVFGYGLLGDGLGSDLSDEALERNRSRIISGLEWLVIENGAQVINVSLRRFADGQNSYRFSQAMYDLLYVGFEFLIVQSAGNTLTESRLDRVFAHDEGRFANMPKLMRRTITVGATDINGGLWQNSNWGTFVDVVAPGVGILVPINHASLNDRYDIFSGTSLSAPHVTALAALMWDENPGLSAEDIKRHIVQASFFGTSVRDERSSVDENNRRTYQQIEAYHAMRLSHNWPTTYSARLVGRVVIAEPLDSLDIYNRIPISGARISIHGELGHRATTNPQGFYRIDNLIPGTSYRLVFGADNFIPTTVTTDALPGVTVVSAELQMVPYLPNPGQQSGTLGGGIYNMPTQDGENRALTLAHNTTNNNNQDPTPPIFTGMATLQFHRGLYLMDAQTFKQFIEDGQASEAVYTLTTNTGRFDASLPPGNYTVLVTGQGIIPTIAHVISYWEDDIDEYWLNQDIVIELAYPIDNGERIFDVVFLLDDTFMGQFGTMAFMRDILNATIFPVMNDYDRAAVFTIGFHDIVRHSSLGNNNTHRDDARDIIQGLHEVPFQSWRAIYSAVFSSVLEFHSHARPDVERIVILMTNGEESFGSPTWNQVAQLANALGVRVYTVGVFTAQLDAVARLQRIASDTGGRYFGPMGLVFAHLPEIFDRDRNRGARAIDFNETGFDEHGLTERDLAGLSITEILQLFGLYEYYVGGRDGLGVVDGLGYVGVYPE
ncbi:MAG: S8 family serine peptidase, partial [Candidatus Bathyarchaeota archaeon]|nr:S8 family serine peptidase [Candidatus Termitimicrobium sp.]